MVPLKTPDILDCLVEIGDVLKPETELHLLGITRVASIERFTELGVTSFDSTSAFRQAFMDDRDNFHTFDTTYSAVRVPQVDANVKLKRAILSGQVSQREAVAAERNALQGGLRAYDRDEATLDETLELVLTYERIVGGVKKSYEDEYRRTLADRPWKQCPLWPV